MTSSTAASRKMLVQAIASTEARLERSLRLSPDDTRPAIVRGRAHLQALREQLARFDARQAEASS